MTDLILSEPLQPFAPMRVDPAGLEQAITEAVTQLREYNAWRVAEGKPPSTGHHILLCFMAANAPTDELRGVMLRWLDHLNTASN